MAEAAPKIQVRSGDKLLTVTDEEIAILENIIYHEKLSNVLIDPDIRAVIQEESAPYFAGDKNVEETSRIIQNRIQIILNE